MITLLAPVERTALTGLLDNDAGKFDA